jgi:hypothetical protein
MVRRRRAAGNEQVPRVLLVDTRDGQPRLSLCVHVAAPKVDASSEWSCHESVASCVLPIESSVVDSGGSARLVVPNGS